MKSSTRVGSVSHRVFRSHQGKQRNRFSINCCVGAAEADQATGHFRPSGIEYLDARELGKDVKMRVTGEQD
jgi:hypothetical protein